MDKYRLVENKNVVFTEKHENEVRLTGYGHITNYIEYCLGMFKGSATAPAVRFVNIQAMGKAISKAVSVAEFVKRKMNGLHQITKLESFEITDVYEPIVEGLNT
jgi:DNA-binding protein